MTRPVLLAAALLAGASIYPHSRTIDAAGPVALEVMGSEAGGDLRLLAPSVQARRLVTLHELGPGAAIACVSARSDAVGPTRGVNVGVHVKSVAVLMDARWQPADPTELLAEGRFDNWENCGVKSEGRPSPASRLMPGPQGGLIEDVFDGNPGTNLNVLRRVWPRDAVQLLLGRGLVVDGMTLRLRPFANGLNRLLVLQGEPGGFIAAYVPA